MAQKELFSVLGTASTKEITIEGDEVTLNLEVLLSKEEAMKLFRHFLAENKSMKVEITEGL